jgi:hypothetical protein
MKPRTTQDTAIRELRLAKDQGSDENWFPPDPVDDHVTLKTRLLRGRKFSKIRRRAIALGVADRSRSKAWQVACAGLHHSWGDKNPVVLYFIAHADIRTLANHAVEFGPEGELLESDNRGKPIKCDAMVVGAGLTRTVSIPEEVLREWTPRSVQESEHLSSHEMSCPRCSSSLLGHQSTEAYVSPAVMPLKLSRQRVQAYLARAAMLKSPQPGK